MSPRVLAILALLAPAAAAAQGYRLQPPSSLGDALDAMRRMQDHLDDQDRTFRQSYVLPERAGQNKVAWYRFDWEYIDVPAPGGGPGGIRLYYYRSALAQAQRALPAIESAYARLVELFAYQPTKRIPYFLYASEREFQATNIFDVGEGTLGVTSNQADLRMLVPYFGDHNKFIEVSTHEMVHQFTVQKLNDLAGAEEVSSPMNALPLWFIEGIAEYYSKGGIDTETDLYLRDLVWNPDPREGYEILPFAEDRYRGWIPTYKLGQARLAFIADVYGREKIQGILENAYLMSDSGSGSGATRSFGALVRRVLDEPVEQVDARWRSWLKRRYYPQYLATRQDLGQMKEFRNLPGEPEYFTAAPDGQTILLRTIDREKGRVKLYVLDLRNPRSAREIASDSQPGFESLHPIEFSIGTIVQGVLAFSAQDAEGDTLYVRRWRVKEKEGHPPDLQLAKAVKIKVKAPGGQSFVQVSDPALSADGSHIAFSGLLAGDPQTDVWVVDVKGGEARRLTNDPYVEKDLHWGPDGIYCSSDATDHGRLNLFRIDPGTGEKTRLTTGPYTDRHPFAQADGSVLYNSDQGGKLDVYLLKDGQIRRVTDFTTGLGSPAPAAKARGILVSTFYGGKFRLLEVPKVAWLESAPVAVAPPAGAVLEIPRTEFPAPPREYESYALRNWRPETGYVFGSGAGNAVAGRAAVLFSDLMRDRQLYVDVSVYGSFDYTQALVLYQNRAQRSGMVLGAFHYVQQNVDALDPNLVYLQREWGVLAALQHPLDRFRRVEGAISVGGIQRYCLTNFADRIVLDCHAITAGEEYANVGDWYAQNGGMNATVTPTLRFGYDTIRYDPLTGPVSGSSAVLELGGQWLPTRSAVTGYARMDLERYFQLGTRANFGLRLASGATFSPNDVSKVWEKTFWLTSADNLRGFYPGEYSRLTGRNYYVANAELQVPLDPLIRLFIFDYVEGVAAMDFGGVFNEWQTTTRTYDSASICGPLVSSCYVTDPGAWDSRTLTGVLGFNVLFGPLILRLHWGHPFDIGGAPTLAMLSGSRWVTNVTLRYFFQ